MDQEQTSESAPETENAEDGSLDQAVEAMMQREAEKEPEPEPEEAPDEDKADEGDPEPELVEAEYEGKQYRVPKELKDALLRQGDYTRKTQEVSAKAKAVEAAEKRAAELAENTEALAGVLAEHKIISHRLSELEKTDWAALRAQDPSQYQLLAVDRQNLILEQQRIAERAKATFGEIQSKRAQAFNEKREAMFKALAKELPKWDDETGAAITQYSVKEGFSLDEIQQWTDPRIVKLADKARRFDELQAKKPEILKRAPAATTLKPGAQKPNTDAVKASFDRLKRENSLEAAAEAMLAREQARRRR